MMAVTPDKVQIGTSSDYLDGVAVDTAAGTGLFRETVVLADPEAGGGLANVRQLSTQLADTDKGVVTNTVIHGLTTGGGGGYRDVKVNPSGALTVDTGLAQPTTPADTQPVSGTVTANQGASPYAVTQFGAWTVNADSVRRPTLTRTFTTSSAGTVVALTPSSGKKLRISWYSLQAGPDNSATVTASIRFGVAGADVHTIDLSKYGQMFAHSFGGADDYIEGAVDQALYLFTSANQRTILNLDYKEV